MISYFKKLPLGSFFLRQFRDAIQPKQLTVSIINQLHLSLFNGICSLYENIGQTYANYIHKNRCELATKSLFTAVPNFADHRVVGLAKQIMSCVENSDDDAKESIEHEGKALTQGEKIINGDQKVDIFDVVLIVSAVGIDVKILTESFNVIDKKTKKGRKKIIIIGSYYTNTRENKLDVD